MFGINAVGRRTGEALVALESPEQAELARKRHKHYLDQRYIEVGEKSLVTSFKSELVILCDYLDLAHISPSPFPSSSWGTGESLGMRLHKPHPLVSCYCVPLQVYSASREDFLRFAGSGGGGGASDNVGIIRMQGLPYRATEEDIVRRNSCSISYLFRTCDHCEGF